MKKLFPIIFLGLILIACQGETYAAVELPIEVEPPAGGDKIVGWREILNNRCSQNGDKVGYTGYAISGIYHNGTRVVLDSGKVIFAGKTGMGEVIIGSAQKLITTDNGYGDICVYDMGGEIKGPICKATLKGYRLLGQYPDATSIPENVRKNVHAYVYSTPGETKERELKITCVYTQDDVSNSSSDSGTDYKGTIQNKDQAGQFLGIKQPPPPAGFGGR